MWIFFFLQLFFSSTKTETARDTKWRLPLPTKTSELNCKSQSKKCCLDISERDFISTTIPVLLAPLSRKYLGVNKKYKQTSSRRVSLRALSEYHCVGSFRTRFPVGERTSGFVGLKCYFSQQNHRSVSFLLIAFIFVSSTPRQNVVPEPRLSLFDGLMN